MKKVPKEVCQAPGTFVWENIIKLSTENDIPITVRVDGEAITGIAWRLLSTGNSDMLYLKDASTSHLKDAESDSENELHFCVNLRHAKIVGFATEPGVLDDIWNIA